MGHQWNSNCIIILKYHNDFKSIFMIPCEIYIFFWEWLYNGCRHHQKAHRWFLGHNCLIHSHILHSYVQWRLQYSSFSEDVDVLSAAVCGGAGRGFIPTHGQSALPDLPTGDLQLRGGLVIWRGLLLRLHNTQHHWLWRLCGRWVPLD